MGSKRSPENDGDPASKRRREENQASSSSSRATKHNNSGIDQTYGQRGAFGSLEDTTTTVPSWDSDLDCEDDGDALAYLRSVRLQAGGIPHVIVAEKAGPQLPPRLPTDCAATQEDQDEDSADRSIYQNGIGDSRGYYYDGAYTAIPDEFDGDDGKYEDEFEEYDEDSSPTTSSEDGRPRNSNSDEIRDAYYAALTRQYVSLRAILRTKPPQSAVASLTSSNPTQVGKLGGDSSTFSRWTGLIKATDPLPAQVASMRKDSVMRLLRVLLGSKSFREGYELRERTSRWIWALLARLPDRGELDYQEIGWVRELGKRAVLFMMSMTEREVLQDHYGVGGSGESGEDAEVEADEGADEATTPTYSEDENDESSAKTGANEIVDGHDNEPDEVDGTTDANVNIPPALKTVPDPPNHQRTISSADAVKGVERDTYTSPFGRETRVSNEEDATGQASDVEMQLDSDMEDGEVPDEPPQEQTLQEGDHEADIESVKARLLSRLEEAEGGEEEEEEGYPTSTPSTPEPEPELTPAQKEAARAQVNLRATLNMILTVAGEFYGQRDLLEFRNPFSRLGEDV